MSLYYCWVTKMANAVVLWVLVYFCVTSVNTKVSTTDVVKAIYHMQLILYLSLLCEYVAGRFDP